MNNNGKPSMKEMLEFFKEDYKYPAKMWIWGKVASEWAGLIIVGGVFLCIFLAVVFSMFESGKSVSPQQETFTEQKITAGQSMVPHLKDIAKFMEVNMNSVNKRQEVLKKLMEIVGFYGNKELSQESAEQKVNIFSNLFSQCNSRRGAFIKELSETMNPFELSEVYESFRELMEVRKSIFDNRIKITSSQEENEQWRALCALCQNETKKAHVELIQFLNQK